MNIAIHGTGRAAGALALAFSRAGHAIVSVHGRSPSRVDDLRSLITVSTGVPDLRVIAVSDDAIGTVAHSIATTEVPTDSVHVSGAVTTGALDEIAATDVQVGAFHPLQTLPDAERGAQQLAGSAIGITAEEPLRSGLVELASSLGCDSFVITDEAKPLYHAAAAAAANFTLSSLALAEDLFDAAEIPFAVAQPLVEAIVANAFAIGPRASLTGPIARGDVETVRRQLGALRERVPGRVDDFAELAGLTARTAGTRDQFGELLE
ncbi:MAG: DUF2520 domain-containing protein [Proteobacteria bacterium]|nr:DUF2520 domain-containing protein [Pseudomonadota bacterium]